MENNPVSTPLPTPPKKKRRWGDRYDGRRIRTLAPYYQIMPYLMKTRVDSQVYFEDQLDISKIESWLHAQHNNFRKDIGYLHVFIAAAVRTISQKPRLNRFIAGRKIFARNGIHVSFVIKKNLHVDSPSTPIKLQIRPDATIFDIADQINEAVEQNREEGSQNEADKTAWLFMICPAFLIKFLVWILDKLDHIGWMPKVINRVSPFHTSFFITNMGSLGIRPVYHHIYEFGSTSNFFAFGNKEVIRDFDSSGALREKKTINFKVVADERICDGHYYAAAFRYMVSLLKHPEQLTQAPAQVFEDDD